MSAYLVESNRKDTLPLPRDKLKEVNPDLLQKKSDFYQLLKHLKEIKKTKRRRTYAQSGYCDTYDRERETHFKPIQTKHKFSGANSLHKTTDEGFKFADYSTDPTIKILDKTAKAKEFRCRTSQLKTRPLHSNTLVKDEEIRDIRVKKVFNRKNSIKSSHISTRFGNMRPASQGYNQVVARSPMHTLTNNFTVNSSLESENKVLDAAIKGMTKKAKFIEFDAEEDIDNDSLLKKKSVMKTKLTKRLNNIKELL